jgi:hypothetical protein
MGQSFCIRLRSSVSVRLIDVSYVPFVHYARSDRSLLMLFPILSNDLHVLTICRWSGVFHGRTASNLHARIDVSVYTSPWVHEGLIP